MVFRVSERTRTYVRARAAEHFIGTCRILRVRTSELDEFTGKVYSMEDPDFAGYSGACRIWTTNSSNTTEVGDEDIITKTTYVSVSATADPVPQVGEYVEILTYGDDTVIPGTYFRIIAVDGGGLLRATRRLQVTAEELNWETS